jgi:hypothetical protein
MLLKQINVPRPLKGQISVLASYLKKFHRYSTVQVKPLTIQSKVVILDKE